MGGETQFKFDLIVVGFAFFFNSLFCLESNFGEHAKGGAWELEMKAGD